jgi:hypothetical protein
MKDIGKIYWVKHDSEPNAGDQKSGGEEGEQ